MTPIKVYTEAEALMNGISLPDTDPAGAPMTEDSPPPRRASWTSCDG